MLKPVKAGGNAQEPEIYCQVSSLQIQMLTEAVTQTNVHLASISETANGTLKFFRTWLPIGVGIAGLLWPAFGEVLKHLPTSGVTPIHYQ